MSELINLKSRRAYEARLGKTLGKNGYLVLTTATYILALLAIVTGVLKAWHFGFFIASPALLCLLPALWWKRYLSILPPKGNDLTDRLSVDVLARLKVNQDQSPKQIWQA